MRHAVNAFVNVPGVDERRRTIIVRAVEFAARDEHLVRKETADGRESMRFERRFGEVAVALEFVTNGAGDASIDLNIVELGTPVFRFTAMSSRAQRGRSVVRGLVHKDIASYWEAILAHAP